MSKGAAGAGSVDTVPGKSVMFGVSNGRLSVRGASIVKTDIACSNGVIHVIDTVLLPPSKKVSKESKGR